MALTQVKTLGIADDAVTEAKVANDAISPTEMKAGTDGHIITYDASGNPTTVGPGTDGQVLTSTGAGSPPAFEDAAAGGISDVVSDTSPQLGGDLDVNTKNILVGDSSDGTSDDVIKIGAGADLNLHSDGTNGFIKSPNGNLLLQSDGEVQITDIGGNEYFARFIDDDSVNLYHDGSIKFNTTATGATLTGDLKIATDDDGIKGDSIHIKADDDTIIAKFHKTNSQEFNFSGSKKLEVNNTGIAVTGSITPSGGFYLGGSGGSNYLDDYEEGTWTPTDGGGIVPFASATGTYTKVGNLVTLSVYLRCTSNVTYTGDAYIVGLPFTSSGTEGKGQGGFAIGASNSGNDFFGGHMNTSSTVYYFYKNNYAKITKAQMWDGDSTAKYLVGTITYFT